jgi:hypothetical protein
MPVSPSLWDGGLQLELACLAAYRMASLGPNSLLARQLISVAVDVSDLVFVSATLAWPSTYIGVTIAMTETDSSIVVHSFRTSKHLATCQTVADLTDYVCCRDTLRIRSRASGPGFTLP